MNYARKEGQREGEYRKAVETAIAMKKDGFSVEAICKYTGLSKEEIENCNRREGTEKATLDLLFDYIRSRKRLKKSLNQNISAKAAVK
ncbi:MAG: hypothetical protein AB2L24_02730 [Mangrovibacterium sp.]